jgi:thiamine transporter ThiT
VTGSPAALLIAFILAIALQALLLKAVAGSILGHTVRYQSALLATVVATLIQYAMTVVASFVFLSSGAMGNPDTMSVESVEAAFARDPLMPFGFAPFLFSLLALAVGLAISIRTFIRSPDSEKPSWTNASLSAVAVTIVIAAIQYGLTRGIARA